MGAPEPKPCMFCETPTIATYGRNGPPICDYCYECGHQEAIDKELAALEKVSMKSSKGVALFGLWRGGECKADVVVLSSGKCIVSWPTSVVVYDSLEAARKVHVDHMGGRGEPTEFIAAQEAVLGALLAISTDVAQDHIEDPCGFSDREKLGWFRIGEGAVNRMREALAKLH